MIDMPQNFSFDHQLPAMYQEIARENKTIAVGSSNLFEYNAENGKITLSDNFEKLLKCLVEINELDPKVAKAQDLEQLNAIFQQSQGVQGGLFRRAGTERWHQKDSLALIQNKEILQHLLSNLGFLQKMPLTTNVEVDHCIIFGATVLPIKKRIIETVEYLRQQVQVNGKIFLLGSTRKLKSDEITYLKNLSTNMDNEQKKASWTKLFSQAAFCTEANAMQCLWEVFVDKDIQKKYEGRVVTINSTKIGASYNKKEGHRPTTEVTIKDWLHYFDESKPQSVFAFIENPYIRLIDQLQWMLITNGRKATYQELIERCHNTSLYYATASAHNEFLICKALDEIARNIYSIYSFEKYVKKLEK